MLDPKKPLCHGSEEQKDSLVARELGLTCPEWFEFFQLHIGCRSAFQSGVEPD